VRALVGYSGFVGRNLAEARPFELLYNSKNIEDIRGQVMSELVCAGAPAAKWLANAEPEKDRATIDRLIACLDGAKAERVLLISTIDVYRNPVDVTESDVPPDEGLHAYGLHRLRLERFVRQRFPGALIIRLPALFGPHLKKNALFDLLNGNQVEKIDPDATFQWYPVAQVADDIDRFRDIGLRLVNVGTEPVSMQAIVSAFFPTISLTAKPPPHPLYRMRSEHAGSLGGRDGYLIDREGVLADIGRFIQAHR
jgi:nucleoside-diphosphate-sugar epimerase